MEIFIVLACISAIVGGIGTAAGKLVYKAYTEELEGSGNNILPPSPSSTPSFPPILDEVKKN